MNNCLVCGKETKNPKFCCRSCAATHNNRGVRRHGKPKNVCLNCGRETRNKKYCSMGCSSSHKEKLKADHIEKTKNEDGKYGPVGMKNYLVYKHGAKCMVCGNDEWCGNPIPLEIHHIDGRSKNNRIDNLLVLCPNCHTFTDTYKSKNGNSDREYFKVNQRR